MKNWDQPDNDQELWQEFILEKEEYAFEILYKKYYESLSRFAWRYVKSKAVAEEIVQETYTDVWISGDSWEINGSVRSYFYRIVRNKCLNHIKHLQIKEKYDPIWLEDYYQQETGYIDERREKQIRAAIQNAIEELPERSRMTYMLHRQDGLTYDEIAGVMDVSVKTVESQMSRTLKILRKKLSYLLI
ncbi:MAG: RNA polymerase sigma-70 factor [Balneolaceae bacterium]|nr:MAG: RNA polymerase sigma-70 factor [Balneolaceae bacterium]